MDTVIALAGISILGGIMLFLFDRLKKTQWELRQRQEFIDKHLFVVRFPSQFYVFPYVGGTNQKKVFFLLSDPRASKALYETISTEEARKRITEIHNAEMEEKDRLGV